MPHIHTGEGQHDSTVSGFVVRVDGSNPQLALHRHKKLNRWLQFGGHIELDEQPWSALAHELLEESGYEMPQLQVLQPKIAQPEFDDNAHVTAHPLPAYLNTHDFNRNEPGKHYHTDLSYVLLADSEPTQTLADGESEQIELFNRQRLEALSGKDIPHNVKAIGLFALSICQSDDWLPVPATDFSY